MPDDHSKSVPPLPIPNRTVKRYYADDSAATSVKVGYRQASYKKKTPLEIAGFFFVKNNAQAGGRAWRRLGGRMPLVTIQRNAPSQPGAGLL